jgi:MarR family multiple antibiotic resistance transcriptional regulator
MALTSDLNAPALQLFDDVVRVETRLYNSLNDLLRERHGIVTSQFEFLRFVRDHPGARVADIAATAAIGIGATSKGIDRLESRELVTRMPHPSDRRSSVLALTASGVELTNAAEATFAGYTTRLVTAALTPAQLSAAGEALSVLRAALERDSVGIPVG